MKLERPNREPDFSKHGEDFFFEEMITFYQGGGHHLHYDKGTLSDSSDDYNGCYNDEITTYYEEWLLNKEVERILLETR